MKRTGKMLIYTVGCLAGLALGVRAASLKSGVIVDARESQTNEAPKFELSPDNPYAAIVERNVFDLHDPPPPPPPKEEKPPPPNVKMTGITTIFGKKQALFIVNEPGEKGKQAITRSLILAEGQREGALEVLEINPKARTAKIKNDEIESLIYIETNKAAAAAPAGGQPGAHAAGGQPGFYQHPGGMPIPARPVRENPIPTPHPNYGSTPTAPPPLQQPNYGSAQPAQPALSPLEEATLIEAQRAQSAAGQIDPNIQKMLPPTILSPSMNQENQANESEPPAAAAGAPPLPISLQPHTTGNYGH